MNRNLKSVSIVVGLFLLLLIWRIGLFVMPPFSGDFNWLSFAWGASYQALAIAGAVIGALVARAWGGWNSMLGRAAYAFALGLLFQSIGQTSSSYYVYFIGEIPYPSWGDLGFFGSIIFYIYGTFMLAKVAGAKITIKSMSNKILAIILPSIGLTIAYLLFIQGHGFRDLTLLQSILDVGYPLGQVFYVSLAVVVYLLTRDILGGLMRWPILCFIVALAVQYLSDFIFLYQVTRELYIPEGMVDILYFISYFLMAYSLTQLDLAFKKVRSS